MLLRSYAETFPGKPDQVARVRREVGAYLYGCPAADDVVLIVSEFASNAVLHSLSRVGTFSVCVQFYPAHIYMEVEDDGGPWYCPPRQADRAHGLDLVAELTDGEWGIDPVDDGRRVVWARVQHQDCIRAAGPPGSRRRTEAGSPPVPPPGVSLNLSQDR